MASVPKSNLPLTLAGAYTALVIYASLYPFSGWHDSGAPVLDFLDAAWPRWYTVFDLVTNALGYLPLGFLWVPALQPRLGRVAAVIAAVLLCAGLSFGLETVQNFLPSRVPSNLDLASNSFGGLIGALLGAWGGRSLLDGGRLHQLRQRNFVAGGGGDWGLLLLGLWLLSQLNPETLLFGNGNLRPLLDLEAPLPYTAKGFADIEAAAVGAQTLAIILVTGSLCLDARRRWAAGLVVIALVVKTGALLVMMNGDRTFAWATPGSLTGLGAGLLAGLALSFLPIRLQQACAALALLAGATLVNLMPDNPYLLNTLQVWDPGHFLNFNGLTRLASQVWPFLALPWLMLLRPEK